jgi:hypothetical protein
MVIVTLRDQHRYGSSVVLHIYCTYSSRCTGALVDCECGNRLSPCIFCPHACAALAELGFMGYRRMDALNLLHG